jgi:LysR family hydrogen peroxide-inducible transcriptional activator
MHLPTLRQLQFLVSLAEQGTFSAAADASHVTQPTLSAAIKELEGCIGVQLVEREVRGARLTRAGEAAVRRARVILAEVQDLVAEAQEVSRPLSGVFRLGAIPTIAPFVLPGTLARLREDYPALTLKLREDQTERLLDDLRDRRLDAALIALPYVAAGVETVALAEDEFFFVGPEGHPLGARNGLLPQDLLRERLLLLEDGHCLRDQALSVCGVEALADGADVTATSLHTLVQMVAGGLGVTLLPRLAAGSALTEGARLTVRPFSEPVIGRSIGMAWRAGSPREAEARLIGGVVKAALSGLG